MCVSLLLKGGERTASEMNFFQKKKNLWKLTVGGIYRRGIHTDPLQLFNKESENGDPICSTLSLSQSQSQVCVCFHLYCVLLLLLLFTHALGLEFISCCTPAP